MVLVIDISTSPLHPETLLDKLIFFLRESGVEWLMSDKGYLEWYRLEEGVTRFETLVQPGHLIVYVKPEIETDLNHLGEIYGTLISSVIAQFGDSIRMLRILPEKNDTISAGRREAREDTLSVIEKILRDTTLNSDDVLPDR
jgi:hypothetical protein